MAPRQSPKPFANLTNLPIRQRKTRQQQEITPSVLPTHSRKDERMIKKTQKPKKSTRLSIPKRPKRSDHGSFVAFVAAQQQILLETIADMHVPLPDMWNHYQNNQAIRVERSLFGLSTVPRSSSSSIRSCIMENLPDCVAKAEKHIPIAAESFQVKLTTLYTKLPQVLPFLVPGSEDDLHIIFNKLSVNETVYQPLPLQERLAVEHTLRDLKKDIVVSSTTLAAEKCQLLEALRSALSIEEQFDNSAVSAPLDDETPDETESRLAADLLKFIYVNLSNADSPFSGPRARSLELLAVAAFNRPKLWRLWRETATKLIDHAAAVEKLVDSWLASL
ncbi:hypothetical protein BT63DRAFT_439654 [Microthyrium microscopicum]|uniref:Uncharacterized protein n=1 Tax=Microthyrium microscopicum TaxID=703497 RepID=A0A6A6UGV9_9PEZI|nr:hypothetical protein BT63DRAFT_439654 [Microthyrium microscopicum]